MTDAFADVLAANERFAERFELAGLDGRARRGLCILTCMDTRIDPLAVLGLRPGDAKFLRNAGGRVTDDVLRTLVLAAFLLGVERFMVVAHTRCRMSSSADELATALREAGAPPIEGIERAVTTDLAATVRTDVERVRTTPGLERLAVGGFLYDVDTGRLQQLA